MWRMLVTNGRWGAAALLLSLSGCTAISDCKYECGQKIRTSQAWHEFDGCNQQCFTCDYRDGWKKGYYDVLTGGDGRPPVVPPKKYWKPPVFTEHDPSKQNDWYTGYQDGAACAKAQPDHHYVPTFMAPTMHTTFYDGETVEVVSPADHVTSPASSEPMSTDNGGQVSPEVEPAPTGDPAKPSETAPAVPKGEEYEKDPEPQSTSHDATQTSATQRLVAGYRQSTPTYLDQLVRNAAHTQERASADVDE